MLKSGKNKGNCVVDKITYDNFLFDFRSIVVEWFEYDGILPSGSLERLHFHKVYDLFEYLMHLYDLHKHVYFQDNK